MSLGRLTTNDYSLTTRKSGQTLIEVLIAFAVTVVIGVGLVTVGLATQKAAVGAKNESQATKLAQEYVEKLRVMRDSKGWNAFLLDVGANGEQVINLNGQESNVAVWTLQGFGSGTSPCNASAPSVMRGELVPVDKVNFCRKATVAGHSTTASRLTFNVEVGWMEGTNTRSSRAEIVLSKWCGSVITGTPSADCQ